MSIRSMSVRRILLAAGLALALPGLTLVVLASGIADSSGAPRLTRSMPDFVVTNLFVEWPRKATKVATTKMEGSSPNIANSTVVTYTSSVDATALQYMEYLPAGYNSADAYPLAVLLTGSGGNIAQYDTTAWRSAADAHNFILLTVQPRVLPGYGGNRSTFYIDGALAPGEQDVLDALSSMTARRLIDSERIYIGGYSMGGAGALNIATLHPGLFAAVAAGTSISDLFQQWDYNPAASAPNFATLLGGTPGQSLMTDTYYYQNSPRFLLPNLMHTPARFLHGTLDTLIPNASGVWPYMQSRHIVDTPGFVDTRGRAFTLQELAALWPGAYVEEHTWPNTDHGVTSLSWTPEAALSFFDAHPSTTNPLTVAFSTYEDRHTHAYWLQLDLTAPWTATPALVYAMRDALNNSVALQVTGSLTLTLDMPAMGLSGDAPLTVTVQPINNSTQAGDLAIVLSGVWALNGVYSVTRDGLALPSNAYTIEATRFTLYRSPTNATHIYAISTDATLNKLYLPLVTH